MCVFNAVFVKLMSLDFNRFGHKLSLEKIFLDVQETEFLTKSFSDSHDSACFFDIISPTCPGRLYY